MLITIVTVTKDDPVGLTRTARSLARFVSEYADCEWLVIDASTRYFDANRTMLATLCDRVRHRASSDRGPYDAMNAALDLAHGEWVWFLNGGDAATRHVSDIVPTLVAIHDHVSHVIYPVLVKDGDAIDRPGRIGGRMRHRTLLMITNPICHQGIISRRHRGGPFDWESYPILADYALWIDNILNEKDKYVVRTVPVAYYYTGGLSSEQARKSKIDQERRILRAKSRLGYLLFQLKQVYRLFRYGRSN